LSSAFLFCPFLSLAFLVWCPSWSARGSSTALSYSVLSYSVLSCSRLSLSGVFSGVHVVAPPPFIFFLALGFPCLMSSLECT
jgi:hypothetical protein